MRVSNAGQAVFAATLIAIGLLGLVKGDFAPIWQPGLKVVPARELLVYLTALLSLATGAGLLWQRTAALAARVLLALLLIWTLLFKARFILLQPLVEGTYQNLGEGVVLVAAAWVLYARLAAAGDRRRVGFATGASGVHIARVLYALSMIAFGLSHFFYLNLTTPLVPGWLPWHTGWAYFTGAAYLAAAAGMLSGVRAPLAAALSAVQMGLFTLLVWVPIVSAGGDASSWSEFVISWALTAGGWVVADSYRTPAQGARA
jgi:uncharacterized membrane protein